MVGHAIVMGNFSVVHINLSENCPIIHELKKSRRLTLPLPVRQFGRGDCCVGLGRVEGQPPSESVPDVGQELKRDMLVGPYGLTDSRVLVYRCYMLSGPAW
jgi:hypothetical protein